MKRDDCVLVNKQTALERGGRAADLARSGDPTAWRILHADAQHHQSYEAVYRILDRSGLRFTEISLQKLTDEASRRIAEAPLVITVGGDGTLLTTSHYVRDGAILGVNSAPGDSVGFLCAADRDNFAARLESILSGSWRPITVARLAVSFDGVIVPTPALNDALIVHSSPAATTRYMIGVGEELEEQRSSGIWVSTAVGSTAGIRSAGGEVLPLRSRRIQYLVRELFREPGRTFRYRRGTLAPGESLTIASKMPQGEIYLDGARTRYEFPIGTRAEFSLSALDLRLYLDRRKTEERR